MVDKRIRIILDAKGAQSTAIKTDYHIKNIGKSADRSQFSLNKLAAAIAAIVSVQKVAQYADAFNRVENQLRRTTNSSEQLVATTQNLLAVANQTRSGLETTVELYTSLSVSTDKLGISQERVIGVTKTINNLFLESGKGAAESAGAIRQLGQALQSGALRGDEFNSVAEGAPGILRAIELQTGKTRGELRELAAQGGITAELIVASLENYSEAAQVAADKTQVTLDQAFTVAGNNLTFFVGTLDDATGASSALASTIIELSNYVASPEFLSGIIQAFQTSVLTINAASDASGDFANELQFLGDVGSESIGLIGTALRDLLPNLRTVVQIIGTELGNAVERIAAGAEFYKKALSNAFSPSEIKKAYQEYNAAIDQTNVVREDSIGLILKEREAILSTAKEAAKARIEEANARRAARDAAASQPIPGAGTGVSGSAITGVSSDAGEREIAQAKNLTAQLKNELDLRSQVSAIYRQKTLSDDASLYQQQLAQIQAKEAEELAMIQSRSIEDTIRREEQFRQALENDKVREEEKAIIRQEQATQQLLAEQILEEQRTAILQEGVKARQDLDKAEAQARLANAGALGQALMTLGQGQSKKIFKIGQTLALAQASAALPSAVIQSFQNGGGYPYGLIPAGLMLATGLANINNIKNAGGSLGGGGGSVSTPTLPSGGGGGGAPRIPSTATSPELTQQKRIIEVRGIGPESIITGEQLVRIFEGDDSVIVAVEKTREDATRRGVIGVTSR